VFSVPGGAGVAGRSYDLEVWGTL